MNKFLCFVAILLCVSCQSRTVNRPSTASSSTLVVAAAANLSQAMPELTRRFTEKTGIRVVPSFGATADLAKQIEHGAPFDVFASADSAHVDQLEAKGLLTPGSRALYAHGRLVMWWPNHGLKAERIEDITDPRFERIAIAKPDIAPYGRATVESLRALGIWDRIEGRVVYAQSVAQTKQFASTGNAEVAFIPLALVEPGEGSSLPIEGKWHSPVDQSLGIIRASPNQAAARKFVDFLLNAEGQEIFAKNGYFPITPS